MGKIESRLRYSIVIFSLIIILRDVVGFPIPDVGILIVSAMIMTFLSYVELVYFLFFLFPLTCGIPGYIMLVGYILLFFKRKNISFLQIIPVLLIFIIDIFDEALSNDPGTLTGILSFISFCGIFFFFLNDKKRINYDIPQMIWFFGFGTAFTFFVIFYNMLQQYNIYYILAGMARSGALGVEGNDVAEMKGHLAMNSNTIAYYAVCCISSVLALKNNYKAKFMVPLLCFILACGLLTLSRTFILCTFLIGIYYYMISSKAERKKIIISSILGLIVFFGLYYDKIVLLSAGFVDRANDANMSTAGGRTELFYLYNEAWLSSLWYIFLGVGVVNHFPELGVYNAMHCGLQQIWVCLGVTGFLIFFYEIICFFKKYKNRNMILNSIPFVITLIFDQSIQFLNPYPLMLPIMVALLVYKEGWVIRHK
ncbi:MAG: hypothetical protein K2G41_11480 [Duncaniella sp.]|uniref:hypothetical protein n=1 Tax=Duncaniella sp. TaxID=2518496 RepID=UPI0023D3B09A|nr:hypothetical protein [Duncaniella sp.]MDE6091302.1 hypothetical protein [Duncaniella sp.]